MAALIERIQEYHRGENSTKLTQCAATNASIAFLKIGVVVGMPTYSEQVDKKMVQSVRELWFVEKSMGELS